MAHRWVHRLALAGTVAGGFFVAAGALGQTFITVDYPGQTGIYKLTVIGNIYGNTMVGHYSAAPALGFIYDESTFTPLDEPLGVNGTYPSGIYGNDVVGGYADVNNQTHGFLYDGTNFTTLDDPNGNNTDANAIYGSTIVGTFMGDGVHARQGIDGFLYNGSTWQTLVDPQEAHPATYPFAIYGSNVVGTYLGTDGLYHGFIYNYTFDNIDDPLGTAGTQFMGIYGNMVVGTYMTALPGNPDEVMDHGFIYNGSTFTTLDDPLGVGGTQIGGIYGDTVTGWYSDATGTHGFIAILPEPGSASCACAIGLAALGRRVRVARPVGA